MYVLKDKISSLRDNSVLRRSNSEFSQGLESVAGIEGFTSEVELSLLYHLSMASIGDGYVVEIGSYLGRSTVILGKAAVNSDREPVIAVDPHIAALGIEDEKNWDTKGIFLENIRKAGVDSKVNLMHMTSVEAAAKWDKSKIRMLFIDGWHSYDAVVEDFRSWSPYLTDESSVVFDDFLPFPEVRSAVRDLCANNEIVGDACIVGKMVAFGPSNTLDKVPLPLGSKLLGRVGDRGLNALVKVLAP